MAAWYERTIVPRLVDAEMGSGELDARRREVLADASGIVLEIGSGSGHNLRFYPKVSRLYALDPSKELIDIARGRASGLAFPVEFLNAGAEEIPLPDHSVDSVVSTWSLCSVADPARALQEVRRVLVPQGIFTCFDHGASPDRFMRSMQTAFTTVTKHLSGNCHYDRPIDDLLRTAGFDVRSITRSREPSSLLIHNYRCIVAAP